MCLGYLSHLPNKDEPALQRNSDETVDDCFRFWIHGLGTVSARLGMLGVAVSTHPKRVRGSLPVSTFTPGNVRQGVARFASQAARIQCAQLACLGRRCKLVLIIGFGALGLRCSGH